MKKASIIIAVTLLAGCGSILSTHRVQHDLTVGVVTSHAVLAALQDGERAAVCGVPGAPAAPACVPAAKHKQIAADFVIAFDADGRVAQQVHDLPPNVALPSTVVDLLTTINGAIARIEAAIPESAFKAALLAKLGTGGK